MVESRDLSAYLHPHCVLTHHLVPLSNPVDPEIENAKIGKEFDITESFPIFYFTLKNSKPIRVVLTFEFVSKSDYPSNNYDRHSLLPLELDLFGYIATSYNPSHP